MKSGLERSSTESYQEIHMNGYLPEKTMEEYNKRLLEECEAEILETLHECGICKIMEEKTIHIFENMNRLCSSDDCSCSYWADVFFFSKFRQVLKEMELDHLFWSLPRRSSNVSSQRSQWINILKSTCSE